MIETVISSALAVIINIGLIGWVYKVMNSNIEAQRLYFEREVKDLREQIVELRNSESRWIMKYRTMYEHFRTHKGCGKDGKCGAWDSYIDKINQEGII